MALILLADDDTSLRPFIASALERAGHQVMVASDGLEALTLIKTNNQHPFDLLLSDVVMPGMDGIELSKRAVDVQPGLKVMFITGFSGIVSSRDDAVTKNKMMTKPFHLNDLITQIERLLSEP